jgi:tetratricopeptide (TPR) repeat protein
MSSRETATLSFIARRKSRRGIDRIGLIALSFFAAGVHAAPQDSTGTIDRGHAIAQEIYRLESMISGDVSAERKTVTLGWLVDMYVAVGRIDDAEAAYEQMLDFFPKNVGYWNAYAEFLLEIRAAPDRALEATRKAISWASYMPSPPPQLGQTYAIRARAFEASGNCEEALRTVDEAAALAEGEAAEDALRTRARCYSTLGRGEEAKSALLRLIGDTGASNPEDRNALVTMLNREKKSVDPRDVQRMVDASIDDARKRRAQALAREDASLVELEGEDHVRLEATLRRGVGPAAILFLPDYDGRRSIYTPYAQLLTLDGYTTLTLDPRGHGDSRCDSLPSLVGMGPHHQAQLPADVATAYEYLAGLKGVDAARVAIVAAGWPCGSVELAIHENNLKPAVVYLSPVFDETDLDLAAAFSFRPPRPALGLASEEDVYAVRSLRSFAAAVPSGVDMRVYKASGRGASILRDPVRFAEVDAWLSNVLGGTAASEPRD